MKKFIKSLFFALALVIAPSIIVVESCFVIRGALDKPFYYAPPKPQAFDDVTTRVNYAKAKENCFLFRTRDVANSAYSNIFFIVPKTYFVIVLDEDVLGAALRVQYRDKIGYVAKDSVKRVDFVPDVPTLEGITFDIADGVGTYLRREPSEDVFEGSVIVPAGTKGITYIASTVGKMTSGEKNNIWYYVFYTPLTDPSAVYAGYIHSGKTVGLSPIVDNTEDVPVEIESGGSAGALTMSVGVKTVLIILICLPIVLVFVLLLISNHKGRDKQLKQIEKEVKQKPDKETEKRPAKMHRALRRLQDLEGQSLEKKPVYYTNFMDAPKKVASASLRPEFPTYEVVDDDDLL